jgi:hypothetical protein
LSDLPIGLELQPPIDAALAVLREGSGEKCLSDFAFSNLYLFREAHGYRYLPGDLAFVSGHAYDGTRHLMPLFDLADASIADLRSSSRGHDCFYPVADRVVARLDPECFEVCESRDDADYLYIAESFLDYSGRALAKKRNLVRQFLSWTAPRAETFTSRHAVHAHAVLSGWMMRKGKKAGEADEAPCREAIDDASRFQLQGFVYFVEDQPIGFVLAQELQPGVFAMRFAKGLDSRVGVYPYMFQHFCRSLEGRAAWLNFEQDMGLPGFRRSKQSYQPHELLAKWRVRLL